MDPSAVEPRPALPGAQPAPAADPPTTAHQPVTPRASENATSSAPLAVGSPAGEQALEWCEACHFWPLRPCDQCPPRLAPQGTSGAVADPALGDDRAPEPPQSEQPCATPPTLGTEAPRAVEPPPPFRNDVDASEGTATQLASLRGDDASGRSPPDASQPADTSDEDPERPAADPVEGRTGSMRPHESHLAALIADTALRATRPPPSLIPFPPRVTASPPSWRNMPSRPASCSSSGTSP